MKRDDKLNGPLQLVDVSRDTVVRRRADPDRRKKLIRLLSILLDSPSTPDKAGRP